MTANKARQNFSYHHSGYPGGLRATSWQKLMDEDPTALVTNAVKGMVPRNRLGRAQMGKLFVYAGPTTRTRPSSPPPTTRRRSAAAKESS